MINTGYSKMIYMNEKVQGNLAGALNQMDRQDKSRLVKYIQDTCKVDFNKAVGEADVVTSGSDKRLKDKNNLIIGIYKDTDKNLGLVAYQTGKGAIIEHNNVTVLDNKNKEVQVKNFGDLSWSAWLKLMQSVYIIDVRYNSNGLWNKQYERELNKKVAENPNKKKMNALSAINPIIKGSKLPSRLADILKSAENVTKRTDTELGSGLILEFSSSTSIAGNQLWNNLGSWCDNTSNDIKLDRRSAGTWVKTVGDITYMIGYETSSSNYVRKVFIYYKSAEEFDQLKSDKDTEKKKEMDDLVTKSKLLTYDSLISKIELNKIKIKNDGDSVKILLNATSESQRKDNSRTKNIVSKLLIGCKKNTESTNTYRSDSGRGEDTEGTKTQYIGSDFVVEWVEKTSRERLKDTGYILITRK